MAPAHGAEQRWRSSATADVVYGSELREGQLQINLSEGLSRVPGLVIRNRENYAQDLQVSFALDPQGLTQAQFDANPEQTAPQPVLYNTRKSVSQTQAGVAWEQALGGGHKLQLMGYGRQRRVVQYLFAPPGAQASASNGGGVIDLDCDYWGFNARWRLQTEWRGGQLDLSAGLAGDRQSDPRQGFENFAGSPPNQSLGVLGRLKRDETNRATTRDPYLSACAGATRRACGTPRCST